MLIPDLHSIPPEVRALYPFQVKEHPTSLGVMRYVDHGPAGGAPVLLLHGNPSWSFLWRKLIGPLAERGFRVIAPDHLGMGLSARPQTMLRLEDRIQSIKELVDALSLSSFHLGVHDWGGAIGLGLATRMPQRVNHILITNTGAFLSDNIPRRIALCRLPVLGRLITQYGDGFAWPATWMAVERSLSPEVKNGFLHPYHSEIENQLGKLKEKKIMLFWGMKDFCFDETFYTQFAQTFPTAQKVVFPKAGHYLLEDLSDSEIARAADFFLQK
ncbi:alpha/beta fold hydrolase [bacterium]|nr:alpha/beta fold hydrolase [bacterium]